MKNPLKSPSFISLLCGVLIGINALQIIYKLTNHSPMPDTVKSEFKTEKYQLSKEELYTMPFHTGKRFLQIVDSEGNEYAYPMLVTRVEGGWVYANEYLHTSCFVPEHSK